MKLFKRTIGIMMAAVMLVGSGAIAADAATKPESGISETDGIVKSTGANVWSFNKNTGEFVLEKVTDFSIFDFSDEIEPGTFLPWSEYTKYIKTAVIGEKVNGVYPGCFNNCENLTEVKLHDNLKTIEHSAFNSCTSLKNITIPESVTFIGEGSFCGCESLESIVIPKSVTEIDVFPFYGCTNLKSAKILADIKELPSQCFERCTSLTEVELPDSIENLSSWGSGGTGAFGKCTSLKSIKLPSNLKYLGQSTFNGCTSLEEITIPESVEELGIWTFEGCTSLKSITIPEKITKIDSGVFLDCTSLSEVKLGSNITQIGDEVFKNTAIYNNKENYQDGMLYIGEYLIKANNSVAQNCKIKEGTKVIADSAFRKNSSIESVEIPEGLRTIDYQAFYKCPNLKKVKIGEGVTKIRAWAFSKCTNLTKIKIPDSVKSIAKVAFGQCKNLKKVTLGKNLKILGSAAFSRCKKLRSVMVPRSVEQIGSRAFCTEGKSFTVIGYKGTIAENQAKKYGLKFKNIKTGKTVDYIKKNPIKIQTSDGSFKAKQLKSKSRSDVVFDAENCYSDSVKVSVVKSKTSKALRNKVKSVDVFYGKLTLKKGSYKKGDYKLVLQFMSPAYFGHKSAVITKTFNIKIK